MKETARLIREWWRQFHLPECPYCGAADISRSGPRLWERPFSRLRVVPYRCGGCQRRFYLRERS